MSDQTATTVKGHTQVYPARRICVREEVLIDELLKIIGNTEVAKFEFMKSATKYVEEIYVRMMEINAEIGRNSLIFLWNFPD